MATRTGTHVARAQQRTADHRLQHRLARLRADTVVGRPPSNGVAFCIMGSAAAMPHAAAGVVAAVRGMVLA